MRSVLAVGTVLLAVGGVLDLAVHIPAAVGFPAGAGGATNAGGESPLGFYGHLAAFTGMILTLLGVVLTRGAGRRTAPGRTVWRSPSQAPHPDI